MAENLNRWIGTGNLTRDPELKEPREDLVIANMRLAVNSRVKSGGEWVDKPNYFDVVCFGGMARNVARYLSKGSPVAIDGRLDWREWEDGDGNRRQAVQIIADNVQFLEGGQRRDGDGSEPVAAAPTASAPLPDDDIPF